METSQPNAIEGSSQKEDEHVNATDVANEGLSENVDKKKEAVRGLGCGIILFQKMMEKLRAPIVRPRWQVIQKKWYRFIDWSFGKGMHVIPCLPKSGPKKTKYFEF